MSDGKHHSPEFLVTLGLLAYPVNLARNLRRSSQEKKAKEYARSWIERVKREGLVCPEGHVRMLDPADRYKCSACAAVIVGVAPWESCSCCGDGLPVSFVDCECGASILIPPEIALLHDDGAHDG